MSYGSATISPRPICRCWQWRSRCRPLIRRQRAICWSISTAPRRSASKRDNCYILLDVYRKQLEFPQLRRSAEALAKHWYADLVLIEAVNAGRALYQELRSQTELNVLASVPRDDKRTRMLAESPAIEAGRVYIPEEAPWLPDFQHEIVRFPNGKYDDQVDSLSQFLYWARVRQGRSPTFRSRITLC